MSAAGGGRLWIRLVKGHRTLRDVTVPCTRDDPREALRLGLKQLDLSQPVWLRRHQADWEQYALTRFTPEHFVEPVAFERMEISYIYAEGEKKARREPEEIW